jgi:ABC-type multidrug transport system ATPase subunit
VRDPQVFLFDEPLSNLDAKLRVQMRTEIKELHQRLKTTTVYVTHDQIEAMTMADKIVVMHDGIVEQMGAPLELYDRPENLFVAYDGGVKLGDFGLAIDSTRELPFSRSGTLDYMSHEMSGVLICFFGREGEGEIWGWGGH